ncbi:MAG: UbiA prenyltransferase family protein [Candidatus Altiarchaeota archaeon]
MPRILRLIRAEQWYKNTVIFLALFFSAKFLYPDLFFRTVAGFFILCLTSSATYILNDIMDREKDKEHPEKKNRPIAAGVVSIRGAAITAVVILAFALVLGFMLSPKFVIFPIALFLSTLAYTLYLKNKAIIDVHVIAVNYLLRSISGAVLIDVPVTPWLIISVFFMALFLALGKRRSELLLLGESAGDSRKTFKIYNVELLNLYVVVVMATLLFSYTFYTFFAYLDEPYMLLTIPFASFILFRYMYFIFSGHIIARNTHYIFGDRQMMVALFLWITTSFLVVYRDFLRGILI